MFIWYPIVKSVAHKGPRTRCAIRGAMENACPVGPHNHCFLPSDIYLNPRHRIIQKDRVRDINAETWLNDSMDTDSAGELHATPGAER